jgi:hypothetical protein
MRTVRAVPVRVLLSAARGDRVEPASYEPDRRAIYKDAVLWDSQDDSMA